jgi:hypothetical protein
MSVTLNRLANWTVPPHQTLKSTPTEDNVKSTLSGIWKAIHQTAIWANKSIDRKRLFGSWVRDQINHLPCETCLNHAKTYLRSYPPETQDPPIWAWRFHNNVNRRLNKPEISWDQYRELYIVGSQPCTSCGR